jgi:8-oxo-dGTP pyrophosphatase MutT (NUDIX family)
MPKRDDPRLLAPQCYELTPVLTLHENPWFTVKKRGDYYTTEFKALDIIVLPVVDEKSIVMVRVKRPVIADLPLELPAGSTLEDELPVQGAARELMEETGIEITDLSRFHLLPPIAGSPNRNPNLLHIFAVNITADEYERRKKHDDEIQAVELFNMEEVVEQLCQGDIYVAVPIAVISRYILSRVCTTRQR